MINNEIHIFHSNIQCINHKGREQRAHNRENIEKVKLNKQLPYLLGNVVEVLKPKAADGLDNKDDKEGGATDVNAQHKTSRSMVVYTLTRQTIYLPVPGLVDVKELKPSKLVGTNKVLYLIIKKLPAKFDLQVKTMEVNNPLTEE
jgi:26S proteasome regulatory subunit T5